MQIMEKKILLRHPDYSLELLKDWDQKGNPCHAFIVYATSKTCSHSLYESVNLMRGHGHEVSRHSMHYAIYLFQKFQLECEEKSLKRAQG